MSDSGEASSPTRSPPPAETPSPELVAKLRAFAERRLSPEEFEALVSAPFAPGEREHTLELIRWFTRRYPTPAERLRYAAQAARRWRAAGRP